MKAKNNTIQIAMTTLMVICFAMDFSGNAYAQQFKATEWKILSGYSGAIYEVEFSPKGNYFALHAEDPIELYDRDFNKIWSEHGYKAVKIGDLLAFSPDEQYLAFARYKSDKDIAILRLSDLQIIQTLTGHYERINSMTFSPDGNYLASSSGNRIKIWKFSNGHFSESQTLIGHSADIESIDFSPDGSHLASGSDDTTIRIWKLYGERFLEIQTLTGHSDWVRSVAFSPDGKYLASGSDDKTIKIWKLNLPLDVFFDVQTLTGHSHFVMDVDFSPDGIYLASGSEDKTIKIWQFNIDQFAEVQTLTGHSSHVYCTAFSQDGNYLATGSDDRTVKIWKVEVVWALSQLIQQTFTLTDNPPPQTDNIPPQITIIEPTVTRGTRAVVPVKEITVRGTATDQSGIYEVTVNDVEASVAANGEFQAVIQLAYGENTIIVRATDTKNNSTTETFTVVREGSQPLPQPDQPQHGLVLSGKYHALIIAVQDYTNQNVNNLDFPIQDAEKLIDVLKTDYTFDQANIHFLKNPDRKKILIQLRTLKDELTEDDNLLIFYSGHGHWDEDLQQGYWLPRDASADDTSEWLSNSTVRDYIRGIKTRHTLMISDACFSGSIFKVRAAFQDLPDASIEKIYEMPSRKALTSGAMKTVPDKSVFLEYLVKNLKRNRSKYLYSEKLYIDMKPAVINNSPVNQTPLYGTIQQAGDEGGDFIFIRR